MTPTMSPAEIDALEPTYLGPTWLRGPLGNFIEPDRTIGWQVIFWCEEYLNAPDGGKWRFTPEQERFVLWWFAVDDSGAFTYRTGVLQRLKGWGKDPLAAVLALVEFVGPCRFSHFDDDVPGGAVGVAHRTSWVQIAAVSRDQTRNTMTMFPVLMSKQLMADYGIKPGAEIIRAHQGRCRIEAVTSSYRALEGGRSTFIILNETHHWIRGNNGDLMYETIWGNATKMDGRYLAITNAYLPGEDSVAEKMRFGYEEQLAGRAEDSGVLYDSLEAHPSTPLTREALEIVLPKIRGDATWLNIETIVKAIMDVTIPPARSRRMWLNQIVADEDAIYGPDDFKRIRTDAALTPGDAIVLGFDGGRFEDSTALVAIRIRDRVSFLIDLWEKPRDAVGRGDDRWEVPAEAVDSRVRQMFRDYSVKAFFADVALWESFIIDWSEDYGRQLFVRASSRSPIGWDMRHGERENTEAHERLVRSIKDGAVLYASDPVSDDLRRHAMNARAAFNKYGMYFRVDSAHHHSVRKVDAYAAWLLAHEALQRYINNPTAEKKRTGVGYFI